MAQDERPWIKLSLDYLDNPKIDSLSDGAILLHLSLLLRAGQQKKDGAVSTRACKARGEGPFKELVKQGLIHRVDALTYQLHDYVKHQTEAKIIQARKATGGRGGHTKNHVRFIYDESCQHCQDDFRSIVMAYWATHQRILGQWATFGSPATSKPELPATVLHEPEAEAAA